MPIAFQMKNLGKGFFPEPPLAWNCITKKGIDFAVEIGQNYS